MPRALIALLLAVGCGRSGEGRPDAELGGLVRDVAGTNAPIDVGRATRDASELARALSLGHERVGELLGPHAVAGRSHLEVREGATPVDLIDDETSIKIDDKGNFHALLNNSKEYGREVYLVNGWMYLRPRYGKYHKRPPADEAEAARVRTEIFGTVSAHFELLQNGVSVSDGGSTEVHGRKARVAVIAASGKGKAPAEPTAQRKWRETASVQEVAGEVALDEQTGAPLRASLRGRVAFQRDGRSFEMRLESSHELSAFGRVAAIAAPPDADTVADLSQPHELAERESLLQGIAPPSRKAPTPGASAPVERK